jgi:hypothetical protein
MRKLRKLSFFVVSLLVAVAGMSAARASTITFDANFTGATEIPTTQAPCCSSSSPQTDVGTMVAATSSVFSGFPSDLNPVTYSVVFFDLPSQAFINASNPNQPSAVAEEAEFLAGRTSILESHLTSWANWFIGR